MKPDLVVTDGTSDNVIVLLNTGVVSFSPTTPVVFAAQLLNTTGASQTVTLTNNGTTALSFASVTVRGPFPVTNTCGKSMAAGASCNFNITFKPTTEGLANGIISITDSASSKPQVIELSGAGTVVELSPQALNFGDQKKGTKSAPLPVTIPTQPALRSRSAVSPSASATPASPRPTTVRSNSAPGQTAPSA